MGKMKNQIITIGMYMLKWLVISVIISIIMGSLSAFFLTSLTWVTNYRMSHQWLLFLLPISGAIVAFLYSHYGKTAVGGNNLVIKGANGSEEKIPLRLIPLTLFGTITTHLFGGSVGREGTAVQMGGVTAEFIAKLFKLSGYEREMILISGISAGFSSVFGTPLAGTLFGIEVLVLGKLRSEAVFPSFFSAFFANAVTEMYGITHSHYSMGAIPEWSLWLFMKLLIAGICFGLIGWGFSHLIVFLKKVYSNWFENAIVCNFIGGAVVVTAALLLGSQRYLGLSLPLLSDAFQGHAYMFDFAGKFFFTILSLGAGFQGGEVTPLFEIGATLGSSLAQVLHVSIPFLAALGFIGVFSGATNTPIACSVMGIELFGSEAAVFLVMICIVSYLCSGNAGIYSAQKVEQGKGQLSLPLFDDWKKKRYSK
ncbi:voltage-gated chloride channel family protein [Enterococcus sp. BWT-B8]|uniref:voltage-gated chloride channel family protein n=1 Tax=Enterococcus sp. BWT-B8 TaxID=2885157 RepID=UPI003B63661D